MGGKNQQKPKNLEVWEISMAADWYWNKIFMSHLLLLVTMTISQNSRVAGVPGTSACALEAGET